MPSIFYIEWFIKLTFNYRPLTNINDQTDDH